MKPDTHMLRWPLALLMLCLASLATAADSLSVNQQLTSNQYLASSNGNFRVYMQGDGNLVLRDWRTRAALWASGTNGKGGIRVKMQSDGNLVMRNSSGSAVWSTKTSRSGAVRLVMQDDGNLVLYTSSGSPVWATNTVVDSGSGGDAGGTSGPDNSEMVGILKQIRSLNGTLILDWDNTIDIDSDYTVGQTAPAWMNAFAEANLDSWLVTGNGNTSRIESAVMGAVSSASETYWRNLLRNKAYYGEATGEKEDKYARIIGSRDKATFMLVDDASANIDDFRVVTNGQGYMYRPRNGYAQFDELLGHLKNFLKQLQDNANAGTGGSGSIQHIGTTQVWDSNGQGVRVNRPSGVQSGDLLVLVLHRTDDHLPFAVSGWTRAAECYKEDNGYQCLNVSDCTTRSGNFCDRFQGKYRGRDLAQVVFYKRAGSSEPSSYSFNLNKDSDGHPGWAILTALRGANTSDPIRDTANRGCDRNADSLFPSVYGKKGDMLLLSQSFDDAVSQSKFGAPSGMRTFGYVSNSDEAGFMYGVVLDKDGETGERKTSGDGASSCKDALVSLTIKAQ